jgi:hypothetical protein
MPQESSGRFEHAGRKLDEQFGAFSDRMEEEVRKVVDYLNDRVVSTAAEGNEEEHGDLSGPAILCIENGGSRSGDRARRAGCRLRAQATGGVHPTSSAPAGALAHRTASRRSGTAAGTRGEAQWFAQCG